ncbi:Calmodulin [Actinomortierella ambigua]|uniref:Calmodulin n=1 Tax=Actinomortierella ambigua TaxID=1343610 RepID=A0A9P6PVG2_9FUNG|nr:Calmodulin [Actinomortierella ambigua]KAG0253832.1 Calmodulin [Actinomortierella ambigua]
MSSTVSSQMNEDEIKEAFKLFDPENTGRIQPQQFQKFLDATGKTFGDGELKASIRLPTHPIDYREFASLMQRQNENDNRDPEEPYRRAFQAINKDGSGHISSQELRDAITRFLGPNAISEADVDEIIAEADVSGDGRIALEEFLKIMHKSEKKKRGEHVF